MGDDPAWQQQKRECCPDDAFSSENAERFQPGSSASIERQYRLSPYTYVHDVLSNM